jgi:ribosomal protein S18 acetylase RimI-like enzyme
MRERGIDEVFLNLFENNKTAIKFYDKMGFERIYLPEIEEKLNKHYTSVAPGSPKSWILHYKI